MGNGVVRRTKALGPVWAGSERSGGERRTAGSDREPPRSADPAQTGALAKRLIEDTCRKQEIVPEQLTLHADRGCSMKSKPVALLLSDLGVTKTHSRPHVSNDNPFSESQFKTLKYRPEFPKRFVRKPPTAPPFHLKACDKTAIAPTVGPFSGWGLISRWDGLGA